MSWSNKTQINQLTNEQRKHQSPEIRALRRHKKKLHVGESGMFQRMTVDKNHKPMMISLNLRPLVYSELHWFRERRILLRPRIEEDIRHFTNKIYPYVKQANPPINEVAWMKTIYTVALMVFTSSDFCAPCHMFWWIPVHPRH